jgi:hypothetical protein
VTPRNNPTSLGFDEKGLAETLIKEHALYITIAIPVKQLLYV